VDVFRSESTPVGGYTWTIAFLEDSLGTHSGDMEQFHTISSLSSGSGVLPSIEVVEVRKGTHKEVQKISISPGGSLVDPRSSFKLRFNGENTADILSLPIGNNTCLGSTVAKQIITTSTEDTTSEGGDNTVSPLTTFVISYGGFHTDYIMANNGTCEAKSLIIADELMRLPPLRKISVLGNDSGAQDEGCIWQVSLLSVIGNPELFTGKYFSKSVLICTIPTFSYMKIFISFLIQLLHLMENLLQVQELQLLLVIFPQLFEIKSLLPSQTHFVAI
jgi:hypothetical protein